MPTQIDRKFNRRVIALAVLVLIHAVQAHAQGIPIGALPSATLPLSGAELIILSQNGTTAKATVNNVLAPGLSIANNRILGNISGGTAAAIGLTASQVDTMLGLGTAAFANLGNSGATVPVLNAVNTWSALQTFSGGIAISGTVTISGLNVTGTTQLGTGTASPLIVTSTGVSANLASAAGTIELIPNNGTVNVTGALNASTTLTAGTGLTVSLGGAAITGNTSVASGTFTASGGAFAASPANANVVLSPTGTGVVTINPATAGTINNVSIGVTTAAAGRFTQVTSTIATGTAPLVVASTTNVANLNASSLSGATFAAPGAIGSSSASTGAFTTMTATSLALNGASIGTNALAATGTANISGTLTAGSASTDNVQLQGGAAGGTVTTNGGTMTLASGGGASTTLSDSLVILSNVAYHSCGQLTTNSSGNILCSAASTYITWGTQQTANFNGVANTAYCIDTKTTGAVTMTLPASPADGDKIQFIDCKSNFAVTNFTVARNGKTIMGLASDMTVATPNATGTLIYSSTNTDWRIF